MGHHPVRSAPWMDRKTTCLTPTAAAASSAGTRSRRTWSAAACPAALATSWPPTRPGGCRSAPGRTSSPAGSSSRRRTPCWSRPSSSTSGRSRRPGRRAAAAAGHPAGGRQPALPRPPGHGRAASPTPARVPAPPARRGPGPDRPQGARDRPHRRPGPAARPRGGQPGDDHVARLRSAADHGTAGTAAADLVAAFEYLQQVRLRHQGGRLAAGAVQDDVVVLTELTALQRCWLKDAVHLLHTCQESVRIAYRTDLIG